MTVLVHYPDRASALGPKLPFLLPAASREALGERSVARSETMLAVGCESTNTARKRIEDGQRGLPRTPGLGCS